MRARLRAAVSSPLERRPLGGASSHACTDGAPLCGRWLLLLIGLGLLGLDGVDDDIHLLLRQELQVLPLAQHRHLNVLAARLHNLEQRSACELDAVQRRLLRVVLFQKLLDRLHVPANRHRLPRGIVARGLRLKKPRLAVRVESHNQRRDAKRTHTTALRISLLDPRHVLRDVLDRRRVLKCQSVALALNQRPVDEHASISGKPSKREHNVVVKLMNFADSSCLLKFCGTLPLHGKHNVIL
mmetsp:Transcript_16734/g.35931  ORF Transcript_16734/g.35931 Transcript_16734/m.35931 type:complete len:241 (+) Transcript_16734:335-1057(+)